MARKPRISSIDHDPDDVMVMARAGFKHRGVFIRTGESVYMTKAEARDLAALHMVQPLQSLDEARRG
ncbi:MAG TPA: hypothetical protein VJQ81_20105 [Reyranella sp.]|nr:hypothetical protein [Reyranella sp.]